MPKMAVMASDAPAGDAVDNGDGVEHPTCNQVRGSSFRCRRAHPKPMESLKPSAVNCSPMRRRALRSLHLAGGSLDDHCQVGRRPVRSFAFPGTFEDHRPRPGAARARRDALGLRSRGRPTGGRVIRLAAQTRLSTQRSMARMRVCISSASRSEWLSNAAPSTPPTSATARSSASRRPISRNFAADQSSSSRSSPLASVAMSSPRRSRSAQSVPIGQPWLATISRMSASFAAAP